MGTKHSIYEKPGTLGYYKFSAEEYALVKKVWSGIEINPQFHGNAYLRRFCETYPQYVRFFTLEPNLPANFDARTTAKFSIIMETMGYLLLDFNNKPKQLDRFVGYIAMVHKDMRLDEQDMHNLVSSLYEYLSQTYPVQMTEQCRITMSKYMDNIIKKLSKKMETFRHYDVAQAETTTRSKLPWRLCTFFTNPLIFGKTKIYWDEWKKEWDERLNEWAAQDIAALDSAPRSSTDEDITRMKTDDDESMISILQRRASVLTHKRRTVSDVSTSRLALLTLSGTPGEIGKVERSPSRSRKRSVYRANKRYQGSQYPVRPSQKLLEAASPRERRRAKGLDRDVSKPHGVTRRHLRATRSMVTDDMPNKTVPKELDKETAKHEHDSKIVLKRRNTARERRRERSKGDLR